MARSIKSKNPRCKQARREGCDLEMVAVRPLESKCKLTHGPGQHGQRPSRLSDYGVQLREKQKVRRMYGVLEKQFRTYYKKSARASGATGDNLLLMLERRLDNLVYRAGFASTRAEARQLVRHKAVMVVHESDEQTPSSQEIVTIPSYQVAVGQTIKISERAREQSRIKMAIELSQRRNQPEWLDLDTKGLEAKLKHLPNPLIDFPLIDMNKIVELYSK